MSDLIVIQISLSTLAEALRLSDPHAAWVRGSCDRAGFIPGHLGDASDSEGARS
jgi:hypothetical protein